MNGFLCFIVGLGLGWWLGPAFGDIVSKVVYEIKQWWAYR